jgi:hypothetical protein
MQQHHWFTVGSTGSKIEDLAHIIGVDRGGIRHQDRIR